MHQPKPFKQRLLKRIAVYSLMTVAVFGVSTALIFLMLGYRYNQSKSTFVQGGLVQFSSQPSGANVSVGTVDLANKTSSKITLNPGDYAVRMTLKGYNDWSKNVTVESGRLLQLNSTRFVPISPDTSQITAITTTGSVSMREGNKNIVILQDAKSPLLTLVPANQEKPTLKTVSLPANVYQPGEAHTFSVVKQSRDSQYILVKHDFDTKTELIMVDLDAAEKSYALTTDGPEIVQSLQFDPSSDGRGFVLYSDGTIRRIDVSSGERSDVMASGVFDFSLTSSGWMFYSTKPVEGLVQTGYVSQGRDKPRAIESIKTTRAVRIAAGRYYSQFHVATSVGSKSIVKSYDSFPDSDSQDPFTVLASNQVTTSNNVTQLSFKADGRLIALQQARSQTVYDVDLEQQFDIDLNERKNDLSGPIQWLDSFHFWDDASGSARQYEFDGSNQEPIVTVAPGFPASYSPNEKYFYSIVKTETGYALQRTKMVIN